METKSMQLWPSGRCVTVKYDSDKLEPVLVSENGRPFKVPSKKLLDDILTEELAEMYSERDILHVDSSLVDDFLKEELLGFTFDSVSNVYPDPSDWTAKQCARWLKDRGEKPRAPGSVETLREAVNNFGEAAEIYEWWRVTEWLAGELNAIGECVLDNDYGYWWGRQCSGQGYIMDGTLQQIARKYVGLRRK